MYSIWLDTIKLRAYLSVWGAGEAAVVSRVTGSVLQTEAGLVTLSYLRLSVDVQQLVQAELVHAVEVTEPQRQHHSGDTRQFTKQLSEQGRSC